MEQSYRLNAWRHRAVPKPACEDPLRIPFASQPAGELLSPEPSHGFVIRRSKSKFHRNPAQPPQPKRSRFGTQVLSTPPNSTAPGKNVEACRRINKYLLFNQQYFDWGCKHGPMPVKPEPSWPALQTNFFFSVSSWEIINYTTKEKKKRRRNKAVSSLVTEEEQKSCDA